MCPQQYLFHPSAHCNAPSECVPPSQVQVTRGHYKGQQGKIIACYRKKWVIHIERLQREKASGATVSVGFNPSKVEVVKLTLNKDRKAILARRNSKAAAEGDKVHLISTYLVYSWSDNCLFLFLKCAVVQFYGDAFSQIYMFAQRHPSVQKYIFLENLVLVIHVF